MRWLLPLLLAGSLVLSASAQPLTIRNRPFAGQTIKQGASLLVELEKVAGALDLKVTKNEDGSYSLGPPPATLAGPGKVSIGSETIAFQERDGVSYVLLDDLAGPCGLKVSTSADQNSFEVTDASVTQPAGKLYSNPALGVTVSVPDGYLLVDNSKVLEQVKDKGVQALGTAEAKQAFKQSTVGLQFNIINIQGPHQGASLSLATESTQFATPAYAQLNKQNLPKLIQGAQMVEPAQPTRIIDGVEFAVVECHFSGKGLKLRSRIFVTVDTVRQLGYCIGVTGKSEADLLELEKLLAGIKLDLKQGGTTLRLDTLSRCRRPE